MKKVLISLFLLISTLMLSSCQVNWFGSHFDVPWYFIAVPVFVLFIVLYVIIVSKTYVCPKCKTEFKPKWYQIYITIHFNDSRIAKCPNCGRKGFCKRKDQCHLFCAFPTNLTALTQSESGSNPPPKRSGGRTSGWSLQKEKSRKRLFLFVLFTLLFSLFTFL